MKRVVTGVDEGGASVFSEVGEPSTVLRFGPGFEVHDLWRLDELPTAPDQGINPKVYSFEPERGLVFRVVVIPPDEVVISSLDGPEPWGMSSHFAQPGDSFGMHRTNTQDLVSVVSGRVSLRLPSGQEQCLERGDVVIQRGAEHAWRNPGPDLVVLHVVMLGVGDPNR